ncbi:MAG: hypothetical protein GVY16_07895, partial [Planctomycetes bacterium]|nr:hypothetical protein [Planctomycetota bacterium]
MRTHAQILIALLLTAGGVGQAADATADAPSEQVKNADLSELYTIGKDTTWVTGDVPRTRDGRVDYAEWLRQHYSKGITRDNNAAVLIVKALGPAIFDREVRAESLERLGFEELPDTPGWVEWDDFIARKQAAAGASPDLEEVAGKQFKRAMAGPWAAEDCPLVSAWLERNDRAMDQLVEASARSHLYFPYVPADDPPTVIGTRIPSLSSLREASEALVARAMLQAREGGLDVAWADLFAVSR